MGLDALPGWVITDAESVRREMEPYVGRSPAELLRMTDQCARDAMWAARASGMLERVMSHRDPLPASTVEALARLRREYAASREESRR